MRARDIVGRDVANPFSLIVSAAQRRAQVDQ